MNLLKRIKIGILYILGSKQAEYAISPSRQTLDQWEEIVTHYAKENKDAKELKKQALAIIEGENEAAKHYWGLVRQAWSGSPIPQFDVFNLTIARIKKTGSVSRELVANLQEMSQRLEVQVSDARVRLHILLQIKAGKTGVFDYSPTESLRDLVSRIEKL